ncbi:GGDEF domain-containing protein [Luteimonas aestuarii]|uniref:diguanylate cyclase n=1 Tax=Luteimonas aestuarii TaxID=453837 RepID=A0A4R5TSQ0_9GAMM|nr:GGDEF domain-containing protein [Luteimonas aestuarii]TDK23407.1 GGDEF domain-containing protein [Luteimonas aestuarii]
MSPRMTPHHRWLLVLMLTVAASGVAAQPAHTLDPEAVRCYQLRHDDPDAAARLAEQRLAEADLLPPDALVFQACRAISLAIMGDADGARAGVAAVETLLAAHPMPPGFELRALSNAGATLQLAGDVTGALEAYERALRAAAREDAWEAQVSTLVNMALLHGDEFAAYDQAEALFAQAAAINDAHGDRKASLSYNRAINSLRRERLADARVQFQQALDGARASGEEVIARRAEAELVAMSGAQDARAALQRLLDRQRSSGDVSGAARSALLQGRLALEAGDHAGALADAQRAVEMLPESVFGAVRRESLELVAAAEIARGDWQSAYRTSNQVHDEQLQRLRSMQLGNMARVQATLVDEHNLEELLLARQQGAISELQASHQRRQRNLAVAALGLLLLLAVGFVAYQRRITRRLRNLSAQDSLTRLLNRHAAGKRLEAMVPTRVDAGDARLAVFLIDIDHFKAINDRHGHDAGDMALLAVANALTTACGPDGVVARWGGEEFLVGMGGLDASAAGRMAERLRQAIADMRVGGGVGSMTVSIGFAAAPVFPPPGGSVAGVASGHWPDAVVLADRALYAAKRGGRDTWVGLWGRAGTSRPIDEALDDPAAAISSGDLMLSSGRPGLSSVADRRARGNGAPPATT